MIALALTALLAAGPVQSSTCAEAAAIYKEASDMFEVRALKAEARVIELNTKLRARTATATVEVPRVEEVDAGLPDWLWVVLLVGGVVGAGALGVFVGREL